MSVNVKAFFQATNPGKALFTDNQEIEEKYYIDFSSVRGGENNRRPQRQYCYVVSRRTYLSTIHRTYWLW